MRSFRKEHLDNILKKHPDFKPNIFVETGTYKGLTIFPMSKYFKSLYTIEINENSYNYCVNEAKKKNINNINFFLGDSKNEMGKIIKNINKNKNQTIFFLDAHVTDNKTGFTGKGEVDVPVLFELETICKNYIGSGIIIIDDARLLGSNDMKATAGADWSQVTLDNIKKSFDKTRIDDMYFTNGDRNEKNDRIIIKFSSLKI